jgi:DNA segregation ATPase FtsK/SpoIIIE, S-DNA-T family
VTGAGTITVRERSGADAGRVHALSPGRHVVGRDPAAAVCLRGADVSRMHASVTVTGEAVVVADLGSKNGVRVIRGGVAVPVGGPVRLGDAGVFEVGGIELEISHPGAQVEEALARVGETTVTRIEVAMPRRSPPGAAVPLIATAVFAAVVVVLLWSG